jgi:hypothetical protein
MILVDLAGFEAKGNAFVGRARGGRGGGLADQIQASSSITKNRPDHE